MTTTDPLTRGLPYEGTVQTLREQAARDAYRGEQTYGRLFAQIREYPDTLSPEDTRNDLIVATGCAGYGWGLVAVLGWLAKEHPELAHQAGCIVQDVQINGGNSWCEDMLYPPADDQAEAAT